MQTFRFEAVAEDGTIARGQLEADDHASARDRLRAMHVSPRLLETVVTQRVSPLGLADVIAFNEQLAQLAQAGLPVEGGLRLVAEDLSAGRLRRAVAAVAADLEAGRSLPEAIDRHSRAFPPLYASVVEAGIAAGSLPAVLFNLGRHLELSRRIRGSLSRALAYPTALLVALVIVSAFLSAYVLPTLSAIGMRPVDDFATSLGGMSSGWRNGPEPAGTPWITIAALRFGRFAPWGALLVVVLVLAWTIGWPLVRGTTFGRRVRDEGLTRLPLVGGAVRFDLVGRWCDAARIGVEAGLDLPRALDLAARTVGSRRLERDTRHLIDAHAAGASLGDRGQPLAMLPAAVPATLQLAIASRQLPTTLATLADLYLRQADLRARAIPLVLTPVLLAIIAIVVGGLLTALFLPIVRMINALLR